MTGRVPRREPRKAEGRGRRIPKATTKAHPQPNLKPKLKPEPKQKSKPKPEPDPITRIFPSPTLVEVLAILLLNPAREFYQAEVVSETGHSLLQVQRALQRIEKAGLAARTRKGNRVYYMARRTHPGFEDLRRLLLKTVGLGGPLRQALVSTGGRVVLAFIFGSIASGRDSEHSDLDLLIVGDLKDKEAAALLGPLGRELRREFNPVVYSPAEFRRGAKQDRHFIWQVIQGEKVWLIGSDEELAAMVG